MMKKKKCRRLFSFTYFQIRFYCQMSNLKRKRADDNSDASCRKAPHGTIKEEVFAADEEVSISLYTSTIAANNESDHEADDMNGGAMDEVQGDNGADDDDEDEEGTSIFEAGTISEVYMENFMNHRKFSLKLGRLVNFITGQNGSGKSACVAAIQLCLGATAAKTGRAPKLAKMVRHGSSGPAICRVKLLNSGGRLMQVV